MKEGTHHSVSKRLLHVTVAHVYRITFKQRNCTVNIKQHKITHNEKKKTVSGDMRGMFRHIRHMSST